MGLDHLLSRFVAALALGLAVAQPMKAFAQDWSTTVIPDVIGQTVGGMVASEREANCMAGYATHAPERVAEVQESAELTMQTYVNLAASGSSADVRAAFSNRRNSQNWSSDGIPGNVQALEDPLARAVVAQPEARLASPEGFFFSGDGASAAGEWTVRTNAEPSTVLGYYRALFRRERRVWKLARLEVFTSPPPTELTNYCHVPGDIMLASLTSPQEVNSVEEPPEGMGQVVFFRRGALSGRALSSVVHEGETELARLPNGRYFIHATDPGAHEYNVGRNEIVRIDVEAGRTYYVQAIIVSGMLVGHAELMLSGQSVFDASETTLLSAETAQQVQ